MAIPPGLTHAFLDLDQRQAVAQSAVEAAHALHPQSAIRREWDPVRDQCYSANDAYMQLNSDVASTYRRLHVTAVRDVHRCIDEARRSVDAFYERNQTQLDEAASAAAGLAAAADDALASAYRARRHFEAAEHLWVSYPSVRNCHAQLEARIQQLQLARQRGDLAAAGTAVAQLVDSAAALESALQAAPRRAEQARRSVASVRTRIDALRTRADGVPSALSAMLREFHADSSADLFGNERNARTGIDRADALLQQATAAAEKRPEAALDLISQARAVLENVDELVDAVGDRLAMLRAIREDPRQSEREVRFRLRDAQRLAVDRGLADEWGSALDAQVARIDRISETLMGPHPDFWRYHSALQDVSYFIADIVSRIRQRSVQE